MSNLEGELVQVANIKLPSQDLVNMDDANEKIIKAVKEEIADIMAQTHQGTKKYNIPAVMVVTPDTYNVVDINKVLVSHYKTMFDTTPDQPYDVKVHKLFAKHIKPEEQAQNLVQKSPNAKERRVLNVYIGTPGRLAKLADMKAFETEKGDRFRLLIVDMRKNKKN